jgi:hypothetical protein
MVQGTSNIEPGSPRHKTNLPKSWKTVKSYATYATTLYLKLRGEHTPKGEVGKNYLVCYSTFRKKETSCKEIKQGHPTPIHPNRRFLMNKTDRIRLEESLVLMTPGPLFL